MNACPNGFRGPPPSGFTWHVLQPSTAALRNGSARNACKNCGIENDGMFHRRRKTAIAQIRFIIESHLQNSSPSSQSYYNTSSKIRRNNRIASGRHRGDICHHIRSRWPCRTCRADNMRREPSRQERHCSHLLYGVASLICHGAHGRHIRCLLIPAGPQQR